MMYTAESRLMNPSVKNEVGTAFLHVVLHDSCAGLIIRYFFVRFVSINNFEL